MMKMRRTVPFLLPCLLVWTTISPDLFLLPVLAIDSDQCPSFGSNDMLTLRDQVGLSAGRVVNSIGAVNNHNMQTIAYANSVNANPVVTNILDHLLDLVSGGGAQESTTSTANGEDMRQQDRSCGRLPLVSGDCYVGRLYLNSSAVVNELLHLTPFSEQVLDTVINTVGLFQEFDVADFLETIGVPVAFDQSLLTTSGNSNNNKKYLRNLRRKHTSARHLQQNPSSNMTSESTNIQGGQYDYSDANHLGTTNLGNLLAYFLDVTSFLIKYGTTAGPAKRSGETEATCIVYNNETFGMASSPSTSFPPPVVYDFCNCASQALGLFPLCPIQPSMGGFAITRATGKLNFNPSQRLGGPPPTSATLFDGLGRRTMDIAGDVWVGADDLTIDLQPFGSTTIPSNAGTLNAAATILACAGVELDGAPAVDIDSAISLHHFGGEFQMKPSFLFNMPPNTNGAAAQHQQLDFVVAMEDLSMRIGDDLEGTVHFSLQPAYGVGRLKSANPDCEPNGFFVSQDAILMSFAYAGGLIPIVNELVPATGAHVDWGLILSGPDLTKQSSFLRTRVGFQWLGFASQGELTFQLVDPIELTRRENFDANQCCTAPPCTLATDPLRIPWSKNRNRPAMDFLITADEAVEWGKLMINDIQMGFTYQSGEDPVLSFDCNLLPPGLDYVPASIDIVNEGTGTWTAGFYASIMDIVNFPISVSGSSILQESAGDFEILSDWDLFFHIDWAAPLWSSSLETIIFNGLPEATVISTDSLVPQAAPSASDTEESLVPERNVTTATSPPQNITARQGGGGNQQLPFWDDISKLSKDGGSILENVVKAIDDNLSTADDLLSALLILMGILETGVPSGPTNTLFAIQVIAELDQTELQHLNSAYLVASKLLVDGDLEAVATTFALNGYDYEHTFGLRYTGDKKNQKTGQKEAYFECEIQRLEWEECLDLLGDNSNCTTVQSGPFPESSCFIESAQALLEVHALVRDALLYQSNCGTTAVDRSDMTLASGMMSLAAPSIFHLGDEHCEVPFTVTFTRVSLDGQQQPSSVQGVSSGCLEFDSVENITSSVTNFLTDAASRVIQVLSGAISGDLCIAPDQRVCGQPALSVYDHEESHTLTCQDDLSSLNLKQLFGQSVFTVDTNCHSLPTAAFSFETDERNRGNDGGCAPLEMKVSRVAKDCCGQEATPVEHTLFVERVAPRFTSIAGSLDVTRACDANIHPSATGIPQYERGCSDAIQSLHLSDISSFNATSCTTTVERTFLLRDNECEQTEQTFLQKITLEDNYMPEFDMFPVDVTLRVFDPYGTESTGFPTAFQKCGASPVEIAYTDEIVSTAGDNVCSEEFTIIARNFTATDACGRSTSRTQTIRIGNLQPPLAAKSFIFVYAGEELILDGVNTTSCLLNSNACGIFGAPDNRCMSASNAEFSEYQELLSNRAGDLNNGNRRISCACTTGDKDCQTEVDRKTAIIYGAQPVFAAAESDCSVLEAELYDTPAGTATPTTAACPHSDFGTTCTIAQLTGTDPVYNVFTLQAESLAAFTVSITAPATGFVLINVVSTSDRVTVEIQQQVQGVVLSQGMIPSRIMWNFVPAVDLVTPADPPRSSPYLFFGTMLNRLGSLHFNAQGQQTEFVGQLFASKLNLTGVRFECGGHFMGLRPDQACGVGQGASDAGQEEETEEAGSSGTAVGLGNIPQPGDAGQEEEAEEEEAGSGGTAIGLGNIPQPGARRGDPDGFGF